MPTVSVCLPLYKGAKFLGEAIESVLAQTYSDFELLIGDDCSPDNSAEIMKEYASRDKRIKVWTNETNLGHYGNYNACIKRVSGKYVKLFAQDDILHPQMLERFVNVMEQHPNVTLINCTRAWMDEHGQPIKIETPLEIELTKPFDVDTTTNGIEAIVSTLKNQYNCLGEPASQMFRAENIDGGLDESFRQIGDMEYNFRQLLRGDHYFVAQELCRFRKHSASWTTTNSTELSTYLEWLVVGQKYKKYLTLAGVTEEEYCLQFIKSWTRNLEESFYRAGAFDHANALDRDNASSTDSQTALLKQLLKNKEPLSFFECEKNAKRDHGAEFKALSTFLLLQSTLLENQLRRVNEEAASTKIDWNLGDTPLSEAWPGISEALYGLKQTLLERDKEIAALQQQITEMGNSTSWKVTAPLRKLRPQRHPN
jgi:glycosyltransferase involved in cell wall biosynthesis